jgi:hypothetical protein
VGTNVFLRNRGRSCWGALEESGSAPSSNTLVFALAVRVDLIIEVFKLAPLPAPAPTPPMLRLTARTPTNVVRPSSSSSRAPPVRSYSRENRMTHMSCTRVRPRAN